MKRTLITAAQGVIDEPAESSSGWPIGSTVVLHYHGAELGGLGEAVEGMRSSHTNL